MRRFAIGSYLYTRNYLLSIPNRINQTIGFLENIYLLPKGLTAEPVSKRFSLVKVKAGGNFNRRNAKSVLKIALCFFTQNLSPGLPYQLTHSIHSNVFFPKLLCNVSVKTLMLHNSVGRTDNIKIERSRCFCLSYSEF